jgi:hypothetical protein
MKKSLIVHKWKNKPSNTATILGNIFYCLECYMFRLSLRLSTLIFSLQISFSRSHYNTYSYNCGLHFKIISANYSVVYVGCFMLIRTCTGKCNKKHCRNSRSSETTVHFYLTTQRSSKTNTVLQGHSHHSLIPRQSNTIYIIVLY